MKKLNLLLPLLTIFLFTNCTLDAQYVTGKGSTVTESVKMSEITAINLSISADVYITQGSNQSIEIKGQQNIIDLINKEARGGSWDIKFPRNTKVKNTNDLKIMVTIRNLEALSIAGSGSIVGDGTFDLDDLALAIGGSGDIKLTANANDVSCSIGGSGDVELSGKADEFNVSVAGSGDVDADDFKVNDCKVNVAGSGDVVVHVKNNLKISLAGSGNVSYSGNPTVKSNVIGSGEVSAVN